MLSFLTYRGAIVTQHYTGFIHHGAPLLGVEIRWHPTEDRAIGILIGTRFIGWAFVSSRNKNAGSR